MKLFIDIVMKRIYLFNIVAWNYRKKIAFPVCKKENFAGLQAHRKRGKSARASPTPHHTLNEERRARFTAQHLSALGKRAPGYRLAPNCFQKFKRMPDPDCFVLLCPIGEQFLLSSFREFVHEGYCLATLALFVHQACTCKGKFYFSTFLTRNKGTTDESKKRLGCYQQEQF